MDPTRNRKNYVRRIGRYLGWAALGLLLFTVLTGYGITEWRIVDSLTFGLLGKANAQRLHSYTEVPMVILLAAHVSIAWWSRRDGERRAKGATHEEK
jgi:hypothetical protein